MCVFRFCRFNRIPIEVLSVVSNQVMTILQALRSKQTRFDFMGDNIRIISTVGAFITMNPGYAGRTEVGTHFCYVGIYNMN